MNLRNNLLVETGESLTAAVTTALRERLEAVRRRKQDSMYAALMAIGKRGAARDSGPQIDHAELLYDENGLPK